MSVVGIYKAVPPRANGTTSGQFRAVLVANNVKRMVRDAGEMRISKQALSFRTHESECHEVDSAQKNSQLCRCSTMVKADTKPTSACTHRHHPIMVDCCRMPQSAQKDVTQPHLGILNTYLSCQRNQRPTQKGH